MLEKKYNCRLLCHHQRGIIDVTYRSINNRIYAFVWGKSHKYIVPLRYYQSVNGTRSLDGFIVAPQVFDLLNRQSLETTADIRINEDDYVHFNFPQSNGGNAKEVEQDPNNPLLHWY